jgi:hypothetical protein
MIFRRICSNFASHVSKYIEIAFSPQVHHGGSAQLVVFLDRLLGKCATRRIRRISAPINEVKPL